MSGKRDAPRILFEIVEEPSLQKRRELFEELIPLLYADEDITWTEAQTRLLGRQKSGQKTQMAGTRAIKAASGERKKQRFRKAARSEWVIGPNQSVNKVALLLRKTHRKPPAESTLREWIRDLKPR